MDLSKIRKLAENRSGGMRKLAADAEMSEANLHRCVNKNSINAGDLEKIAQLLNVPVGYFFDEQPNIHNVASGDNSVATVGRPTNVSAGGDAVLQERVKYLEQLVKEKERLIKVYEKMTEK